MMVHDANDIDYYEYDVIISVMMMIFGMAIMLMMHHACLCLMIHFLVAMPS